LKALAVALPLLLIAGCESSMPSPAPSSPRRDINAVLADNDKRLMAMPGVVGVYVGLLDDGVTPCLKVMLRQSDPKLERSLPRMLEGYKVVTEVTGEIRPMAPR
jgi:hypothetical protein